MAAMEEPTYLPGLIGMLEPFEDKPRAQNVLVAQDAHVVLFEFAAGQTLHEHQAHHAVIVQCLAGHLRFEVGGAEHDLRPGDLIHLPPKLPHAVHALDDSTMTVTMLVAGER